MEQKIFSFKFPGYGSLYIINIIWGKNHNYNLELKISPLILLQHDSSNIVNDFRCR